MVSNNLQKQSPFAVMQLLQVSTGEPEDGARQDETFTPTTREEEGSYQGITLTISEPEVGINFDHKK